MDDSLSYWLKANYRKVEPQIAQDSAADLLQSVMNRLTHRWRKRFDEVAEQMAQHFSEAAAGHADRAFAKKLAGAGFKVKFRPSPGVTNALKATTFQNVSLIKSIAEEHMVEVNGLVMRSIIAGRDLGTLTKELQARYGIIRRRAAFIARDQNNKATATINRTRQMELGLKEAIWVHSSAGRHPRESHVKAGRERLRYDLSKGALIDGQWIHPGELPNCRCTSSVIIPGFDD
ncbi:phage head morphogenesis protein [Nguyenibacter vanlangensis]|uniref:Phage head morphogenesis protein n=2 Tax=Nguyenibacter vanlangensis TaxID=1216886 RepID=A0A7Y7IST9_9PROT|nr:phage head morphogenesis protein [Nguyenibacter vanlangensis]